MILDSRSAYLTQIFVWELEPSLPERSIMNIFYAMLIIYYVYLMIPTNWWMISSLLWISNQQSANSRLLSWKKLKNKDLGGKAVTISNQPWRIWKKNLRRKGNNYPLEQWLQCLKSTIQRRTCPWTWSRWNVAASVIQVAWKDTKSNLAYAMTKILTADKRERLFGYCTF